MSKKNIAVLVSGGGTNLQSILDAQDRGELGECRVTLVISSNPDAYALTRAAKHDIPTQTLVRKDYPDIAAYSAAIRDALLAAKADLVVLAGFMTIIDEQVCKAFPYKIINIHPALIPSFCGKGYYGLRVHEAALKKGVKLSGATVHFVIPECDAGPIILQKAVLVRDDDTPETLQKRIMAEAESELMPKAVRLFCEDRIVVKDGKTYIR